MCGILGSINLPLTEADLDKIAHRGPDASALQQLTVDDDQVWLGHRRLSIVDLSPAGAQPMASACGRYHLVFNGEITTIRRCAASCRVLPFAGIQIQKRYFITLSATVSTGWQS